MVGNRGPIVEGYQSCCTIFTNIIARHITTAPHFPTVQPKSYSETWCLINLGTKLIRFEH